MGRGNHTDYACILKYGKLLELHSLIVYLLRNLNRLIIDLFLSCSSLIPFSYLKLFIVSAIQCDKFLLIFFFYLLLKVVFINTRVMLFC
ncbi:hypothetical protein AB4K20DRAFT_1365141 [Rhizopus microsporus]